MNVHISYKIHKTPDIEKEINHFIEKLNRRLRAYRPELVHLKGLIEENSPREGVVVNLNLRLPSGQMAAHEAAGDVATALKTAFDDIVQQIGKHKELLRSSHKWRRRGVSDFTTSEAPADQIRLSTPPSVEFETPPSPEDIRSYVNTHISRLEMFVERELYFRDVAGEMISGSVSKEEVVDEAVLRALGSEEADGLRLEPWLYQLAMQSMNDLIARARQESANTSLDRSIGPQDVSASGETELQFHQPDEYISTPDLIADGSATPEEIAYTSELNSLVQFALGDVSRNEREIFVLHALEGFSLAEIASITGRTIEEVRNSVIRAREKLRRSTPVRNGLSLQQTGTD